MIFFISFIFSSSPFFNASDNSFCLVSFNFRACMNSSSLFTAFQLFRTVSNSDKTARSSSLVPSNKALLLFSWSTSFLLIFAVSLYAPIAVLGISFVAFFVSSLEQEVRMNRIKRDDKTIFLNMIWIFNALKLYFYHSQTFFEESKWIPSTQ